MPTSTQPPVLPRPFLKWAGGKRQLLPDLRRRLPPNWRTLRYYEPFVGAGALLFDLTPRRAVINDANEQLILTYRALMEDCEGVIALLEEHRSRHCREYYYEIRALDREPGFARRPDTERAARFIYLNKTCYNGLHRVNRKGWFNVPCGRYVNPAICEPDTLRAVGAYLRRSQVTLLCGDFAAAVRGARRNSFVYFDPPYHSPDKANFTSYHANSFGEAEQIRLRDTFEALTQRGAHCLLSNSDTPFIRDLYRNYPIDTLQARRAINSDAARRGAVSEVLIRNW